MSIRITSSIAGFRRAGAAHPAVPTLYPDDHFSPKQIRQLEAEPRLVVEHIEDPAQTGDGDDPQGAVGTAGVSESVDSDQGDNLLQPLIDLIAALNPNDESLWTKDGVPKASNFPNGTDPADRANAWDMFKAGNEA